MYIDDKIAPVWLFNESINLTQNSTKIKKKSILLLDIWYHEEDDPKTRCSLYILLIFWGYTLFISIMPNNMNFFNVTSCNLEKI